MCVLLRAKNLKLRTNKGVANKFREKPKAEEPQTEEEVVMEETSPEPAPPKKTGKKGVLAKGLSTVFSGTFLTNEKTLKAVPYIMFLACIAILYIAYGYYADNTIRESNKVANELKELRSDYISTKSELMFASKQSEVAKAVDTLGLKEPVVPPMKIEADSTELYKEIK
jgi:hypothetical protein